MNVWDLFVPGRTARLQARLANEIAQRCRVDAWRRIERRATGMRLSEARGYMRARATEVIHREVDHALACQAGAERLDRGQLVNQAGNLVVALLFRDLLHVPVRYRPLRRAA